ncbi:unnamed protein product, partial [Amoebophrya sp. A25]
EGARDREESLDKQEHSDEEGARDQELQEKKHPSGPVLKQNNYESFTMTSRTIVP